MGASGDALADPGGSGVALVGSDGVVTVM